MLAPPCQDGGWSHPMTDHYIAIVVCGLDSSLFALAQATSSSAKEILGNLEEVSMKLTYEALQMYIVHMQILQQTLR